MPPIPTPLGPVWLVTKEPEVVTHLLWTPPLSHTAPSPLLQAQAEAWLRAYFQGEFLPIPFALAPQGTPFQQRVWFLLRRIPPGQTLTYGEAAHLLQSGPRAVGGAAGRNPLPLFIPCHRLVAATPQGGGFSAPGGLVTKHWLLEHERTHGDPPPRSGEDQDGRITRR